MPGRRTLLIAVAVVAVAAGAYSFLGRGGAPPAETAVQTATDERSAGPQPSAVNGKYLFSGTIVLDRVVVTFAKGDPAQPFSKMDSFGQFDARLADLECPVTDAPNQYQVNVDNPHFNCRPDWLPAMKKYYSIVKLAGNHTFDMGASGFTETLKHLDEAGIQAVGHYDPHADPDHNCEVVALPVRIKQADGTEGPGTLPVAFCAYSYKSLFAPEAGELELIEKYAKAMPVFGLLQSGTEYTPSASELEKSYARKMIDLGAEFVIGNGHHWIANTEAYKGKLITYSLGNFIFDQIDYETQRNANISVDMSVDYDANIAKWLALGESCFARQDDCLAQAEQQGLTRFQPSYEFDVIAGTSGARKLTERADETLQAAVEERLDWSQTKSGLSR